MNAISIQCYLESEIDNELARMIASLACRSFPSDKTVQDRMQQILTQSGRPEDEIRTTRRFVLFDKDGQVVAHAKTFVRTIRHDHGQLPVLALATVCTDPDLRGQGLGAKVTKAAFQQIALSAWPDVSLFQTPVPVFYEKLNCRLVDNMFVDRTNVEAPEAFPWRDDKVMIFPADFNWPDGVIDINGSDY